MNQSQREIIDSIPEARLVELLATSKNLSAVFDRLGIRVHTDAYKRLYERAARDGVDIRAILGSRVTERHRKPRLRSEDALAKIAAGQHCSRGVIKRSLVLLGYVKNACAICSGPPEWQGMPLTLQLDHIDGDRKNNKTENLRLVCPNCHSQTPTYCGRNARRPHKRKGVARYCVDCKEKKNSGDGLRCLACGAKRAALTTWRKRNPDAAERPVKPSLEKLLELVEASTYRAVGKLYGVSCNTVRKWIRSYGAVPPRKKFHNSANGMRV